MLAYTGEGIPQCSLLWEPSKDGMLFYFFIPVDVFGKQSEAAAEAINARDAMLGDSNLRWESWRDIAQTSLNGASDAGEASDHSVARPRWRPTPSVRHHGGHAMQYPAHEWRQWNDRPAPNPSEELGRLSAALKRTHGAAGMQGISPRQAQPPCSKCHAEPRYPGQRWGQRCFGRYHANRRARLRREREGNRARDKATIHNTRRPYNTPPPLFEQLKRVVLEIPKYRNRPETIRISLLPYRQHMYVDVRTYLKGKPTRKGIAIHRDLVPAVIEGMQRAMRTWWDDLPRQWDREPGPTRGQTGVTWPENLW
jgi:hypothetical protein